ncbi:RNA-binding protein 41-like [Daktulosphaira vitifoliae]|uniref:RNA-binding protein 41-like n=1 Tax=Daktulosphaira vitifoliae TaxID=58002 RepID=UPI0021A9F7CE|nr:RNA-binding protein 41-like [Daktulosphaira vitifoliae]
MAAFQRINSKNSSRYLNLTDFERLESHVESEGDLLIKNLASKQVNTNLTFEKQLAQERDFITSHEYVPITECIQGTVKLPEFCSRVEEAIALEKSNSDEKELHSVKIADCLSRHERELALCVKPNSTETKLLQFALLCRGDQKSPLKSHPPDHPINNLSKIFEEKFNHLDVCPIKTSKTILRKRRQLLQSISKPVNVPEKPIKNLKRPYSLWDLKEKYSENRSSKIYSYENNNTNQCIGELKIENKSHSIQNKIPVNGQHFIASRLLSSYTNNFPKITQEEIKSLPHFKNYQIGDPSKILYIKNIAKNVNEKHLISIFEKYKEKQAQSIIYRYMKQGRMKGQAFVEFENFEIAHQALHENNGIIVEGKPLVISFGKK